MTLPEPTSTGYLKKKKKILFETFFYMRGQSWVSVKYIYFIFSLILYCLFLGICCSFSRIDFSPTHRSSEGRFLGLLFRRGGRSKAHLVLAPQSLPGSYTPPKRLTSIDKLPPYSRRGVFHNPPPQICLAAARLGSLTPSPSRPATVRFSHS